MRRVLEKLRSVLGISAFGALLGSVFGGALLGVGVLVSSGEVTVAVFALGVGLAAGAGAFMGGAFGSFLAVSRPRSLAELGLDRSAALGALAGAAFPFAAAVLTGGWLVPLAASQLIFLGGVFGTLGAGLSVGLVAVAKDAEGRVLEPASAEPLLSGGEI